MQEKISWYINLICTKIIKVLLTLQSVQSFTSPSKSWKILMQAAVEYIIRDSMYVPYIVQTHCGPSLIARLSPPHDKK